MSNIRNEIIEMQAIYETDTFGMVVEPVLDISQPLMTLLAWTLLFFMSFPANLFDWYITKEAGLACKDMHGEEWEAFSQYAATGRGNPIAAFDWDRLCYNPKQCGIIELTNPNMTSSGSSAGAAMAATSTWYMAYQYKKS